MSSDDPLFIGGVLYPDEIATSLYPVKHTLESLHLQFVYPITHRDSSTIGELKMLKALKRLYIQSPILLGDCHGGMSRSNPSQILLPPHLQELHIQCNTDDRRFREKNSSRVLREGERVRELLGVPLETQDGRPGALLKIVVWLAIPSIPDFSARLSDYRQKINVMSQVTLQQGVEITTELGSWTWDEQMWVNTGPRFRLT